MLADLSTCFYTVLNPIVMKNLFIKFCLLIPIVLVNPFRADCQIGWIVNGNALPENTYRYLGAGSCTEVRIIADSVEMMSFKPACLTGAGGIITLSNTDLFDLDGVTDVDWSEVKSFRMGGVVVTTDTGTAKYCELKTTSLSGMKGFKMKAAGQLPGQSASEIRRQFHSTRTFYRGHLDKCLQYHCTQDKINTAARVWLWPQCHWRPLWSLR